MSYFDCNSLQTCKKSLWSMCLTYLISVEILGEKSQNLLLIDFWIKFSAVCFFFNFILLFFGSCTIMFVTCFEDLKCSVSFFQVYTERICNKWVFPLEGNALKKQKVVKKIHRRASYIILLLVSICQNISMTFTYFFLPSKFWPLCFSVNCGWYKISMDIDQDLFYPNYFLIIVFRSAFISPSFSGQKALLVS